MNLAIMAEGAMAVPLYSRQAPDELVAMMKDCGVSLLCCAGASEIDAIRSCWSDLPPVLDYSQALEEGSPDAGDASQTGGGELPGQLQVVTIIYTSGTSGEPKGVMLNGDNIDFMLQRTTARLEELMQGVPGNGDDRVFHYLPLCFAGSWILLLTCLYRNNNLMLSTDLNRLADEWKLAAPQYMLNVPALLERIRTGVEEKIRAVQAAWDVCSSSGANWPGRANRRAGPGRSTGSGWPWRDAWFSPRSDTASGPVCGPSSAVPPPWRRRPNSSFR